MPFPRMLSCLSQVLIQISSEVCPDHYLQLQPSPAITLTNPSLDFISLHSSHHQGLPRWRNGKRIRLPVREVRVWSLGREGLLEKEMATRSRTLDWEVQWKRRLVGCSPGGSQKCQTWLSIHTNSSHHHLIRHLVLICLSSLWSTTAAWETGFLCVVHSCIPNTWNNAWHLGLRWIN